MATSAFTVSRLLRAYSTSALGVSKLAEKCRNKGLTNLGKLYSHPLGNRSLKYTETASFLRSQDKAERLTKEDYVFKLNMVCLFCVIVYLLLLKLFNFSAFQSKINQIHFIHSVAVLLSHSSRVRV